MSKILQHDQLLAPISSEHLQLLRICENIRSGLRNNVEMVRIRNFTDWFRDNYLEPHFKLEEEFLFPLLGKNVRVRKALANHRRIRKLLSCDCDNERVLNLLEEELSTYIRYEERVLFKELEDHASPDDLLNFQTRQNSTLLKEELWEDKFWLT